MVTLGVPYRRRGGMELHVLAADFSREKNRKKFARKCDELPHGSYIGIFGPN
jgi:hypothetical protein